MTIQFWVMVSSSDRMRTSSLEHRQPKPCILQLQATDGTHSGNLQLKQHLISLLPLTILSVFAS